MGQHFHQEAREQNNRTGLARSPTTSPCTAHHTAASSTISATATTPAPCLAGSAGATSWGASALIALVSTRRRGGAYEAAARWARCGARGAGRWPEQWCWETQEGMARILGDSEGVFLQFIPRAVGFAVERSAGFLRLSEWRVRLGNLRAVRLLPSPFLSSLFFFFLMMTCDRHV